LSHKNSLIDNPSLLFSKPTAKPIEIIDRDAEPMVRKKQSFIIAKRITKNFSLKNRKHIVLQACILVQDIAGGLLFGLNKAQELPSPKKLTL